MDLTLFITQRCSTCKKVEAEIRLFVKLNKNINLIVKDIKEKRSPNLLIVPALFVNNILFSYGEVNLTKLSDYLFKL